MNYEYQLDELFGQYGAACPEVDPGVNFMPALWQKIESRSFAQTFQRLGKILTLAAAAMCLFLFVLNYAPLRTGKSLAPTYTEALAADQTAEKTYYTEAIHNIPSTDKIYEEYSQ